MISIGSSASVYRHCPRGDSDARDIEGPSPHIHITIEGVSPQLMRATERRAIRKQLGEIQVTAAAAARYEKGGRRRGRRGRREEEEEQVDTSQEYDYSRHGLQRKRGG
jgi:hypothetical protein